jgi:hypothetical protein
VSRSKRGRRPQDARGAKPAKQVAPARRRPSGPRTALIVIAVVGLGALAWWGSQRGNDPARPHAAPGAIVPVPLDSVAPAARMFEAATMRSDWAEALRWQERITAALPTNALALRQLAQTLHNHHYAITLPDGRQHWLLRNSLVRAEWEARVVALFDSSAAVTHDPQDQARAHYWKGRSAEYEGLPLDALAEYEAALALVPADTTLQRVRDLQRRKLFAEP